MLGLKTLLVNTMEKQISQETLDKLALALLVSVYKAEEV